MFFLGKTAIGLDIDDLSLELVQLQQTISGAKIISSSHMVIPAGIITNGIIIDEVRLSSAINQLFEGAEPAKIKPGNIIFGLPHAQFYPALVELPIGNDKQLETAIWQAAYANLPFEADDLLLEYKILEKTSHSNQVLLIGTSKKYVASWRKLLAGLNLTIDIFDISSYALWRDLAIDNPSGNVALIDIGANKSNIFIFKQGQLNYSYDFDSGGDNLTEILSSKFKLSIELAEDKKIKLGLNRQIFPVLEHALQAWAKEVSVAVTDYESKTGEQVSEIKLVGGGANLKGLANYCQEKFSVPVGNGCLKSFKSAVDSLFFEACGLALRGLDTDKYKNEPYLSLLIHEGGPNKKLISQNVDSELNSLELGQEDSILGHHKIIDEGEGEYDELSKINKFKLEKKLLLAILLILVLVLGAAYWYRNSVRAKKLAENSSPVVLFSEVQSFPYKITVALDDEALTSGLAKGRLINDIVANGTDFNEILNISRRKVTSQLQPEEELWPEPLNEIIDKTNIIYPVTFRWLVINRKEILILALAEIDRQNVNKTPYEFNAITKTKIEKTDSADKVYLFGDISVSLNEKIAEALVVDLSSLAGTSSTSTDLMATTTEITSSTTSEDLASTTEVVGTQQLKIGPTETGWLNVRQGPGRNFEILAKIYPDESYEYVKKEGDWLQIVLKDGRLGWILTKYAILSI